LAFSYSNRSRWFLLQDDTPTSGAGLETKTAAAGGEEELDFGTEEAEKTFGAQLLPLSSVRACDR
jgi:hypothetical protein